ncbi:hypothetical protein [uncultured Gordonia sp.]|uniref:hypothetical protein n=1 Tax=uncultured Gordonia sp. TaxID=198437 RepID=UPI00259A2B25|nr:hypothetical protein [uncultured Gordonia sp.]
MNSVIGLLLIAAIIAGIGLLTLRTIPERRREGTAMLIGGAVLAAIVMVTRIV